MQDGSSFTNDSEDTFTPVKSKRRKKRTNATPLSATELFTNMFTEMREEDWMKESMSIVQCAIQQIFASAPTILCLGLGSPSHSREARAQLCFLVQLRDMLDLEGQDVAVYDPILSDEDDVLLRNLNIRRLSEDVLPGMHSLAGPTIAFMPHCERHLYESILCANWTPDKINKMLLIGNSLHEYVESLPSSRLQTEYPCTARISHYIIEKVLPEYHKNPIAFNSTAVQYIVISSLPVREEHAFWQLPVGNKHRENIMHVSGVGQL